MAYLRVIVFLLLIAVVAAIFVKYVILGLWKLIFVEKKFFKKVIDKSNIEEDIENEEIEAEIEKD